MSTTETKIECIAQLGDANPVDYGGYWVFQEGKEFSAEYLYVIWGGDERSKVKTHIAYRFDLTPCTFLNGILSDNMYHPNHPAWFAAPESERIRRPQDTTYLKNLVDASGVDDLTEEKLIEMLCSNEPLPMAEAYRFIGEYHGFQNLDQYPLNMTYQMAKHRYDLPQFQIVNK